MLHVTSYTPAALHAAYSMTICDAQGVLASDAIGEPVDAVELQAAYMIVSADIPAYAPAFDCLDAMAYGAALEGLI